MRTLPLTPAERWLGFLAATFLGATTVWLELTLVRLYSYLYPAWLAFPLVSLVTLGLGIGGLLGRRYVWSAPWWTASWAAASAAASVALLTFAGSAVTGFPSVSLLVLGLGFLAPFTALGGAVSMILRRGALLAGFIISGYLLGAGIAALGYAPTLNLLSWPGGIALAIGFPGIAAVTLLILAVREAATRRSPDDDPAPAMPPRVALVGGASLVAVLLGGIALVAPDSLAFHPGDVGVSKTLFQRVQAREGAERATTSTWNAFARTDVTQSPDNARQQWLYEDAVAPVSILPDQDLSAAEQLRDHIGFAPFILPGSHDRVLALGAGAIQAAMFAVLGGANEITVLESDPGRADALRQLPPLSGGRTRVRLVVQDPRTYLQASQSQYDVIYVVVPSAGAAQLGGRAVAGASLLTAEAFSSYLNHLQPEGRLVLQLTDERDLFRAFGTAFAIFLAQGETPLEAVRHMVALVHTDNTADDGSSIMQPVLVIRRISHDAGDVDVLTQALAERPIYAVLFMPFLEGSSPLGVYAIDHTAVSAAAPFNVRPATDDYPFFYEFSKRVPGRYVLVLVAVGIVLGIAFSVLRESPAPPALDSPPSAQPPDDDLSEGTPWRLVLFVGCAALGAALAGPPLLHRLAPLLGGTGAASTLGVGSLLLGGALAAAVIQRIRLVTARLLIGWAALVAGLLLVTSREVLPLLATSLVGQAAPVQLAVALALVVPVGFASHIALPGLVRLASATGQESVVPLLWGTLGGCLVLGSALGMVLALQMSLVWCSYAAALLFFVLFLLVGLRIIRFDRDEVTPTTTQDTDADALFRRPTSTP